VGKPLPATGEGFTTGVTVVVATCTVELVVELVVDEAGVAEFVH